MINLLAKYKAEGWALCQACTIAPLSHSGAIPWLVHPRQGHVPFHLAFQLRQTSLPKLGNKDLFREVAKEELWNLEIVPDEHKLSKVQIEMQKVPQMSKSRM